MRRLLVLTFFVLLMSISGAALAQSTPTPTLTTGAFCGTLSQSDCALITGASAAMRTLKSASVDFQMSVDLSNIPDSTSSDISVQMKGSGAYAIDSSALSPLLLSPADLAQNMDQLQQLIPDAIRAISAQGNFTLFFPESFREAMAGSGGSDVPLPEKAGFSARLVGGTMYLNLDKMAALDTNKDFPKGWFGFDLAGYYGQLLNQQAGGVTSTLNPLQGMNLSDPATLEKYITVERQPDATLSDQTGAVFKTSFDLGAFYGSDEFAANLRQIYTQNQAAMGISKSQIDQIVSMVQSLFKGFTLEVTQTIGLTDSYTHQITLSLNWPFDINALTSASGLGDTGSSSSEPLNIQMSLQADFSQFNAAPTITAPENATIIPLSQLTNLSQSFKVPGL